MNLNDVTKKNEKYIQESGCRGDFVGQVWCYAVGGFKSGRQV